MCLSYPAHQGLTLYYFRSCYLQFTDEKIVIQQMILPQITGPVISSVQMQVHSWLGPVCVFSLYCGSSRISLTHFSSALKPSSTAHQSQSRKAQVGSSSHSYKVIMDRFGFEDKMCNPVWNRSSFRAVPRLLCCPLPDCMATKHLFPGHSRIFHGCRSIHFISALFSFCL